jgi:hypothetical protein
VGARHPYQLAPSRVDLRSSAIPRESPYCPIIPRIPRISVATDLKRTLAVHLGAFGFSAKLASGP